MSVAADVPREAGWIGRVIRAGFTFIVGTLLCLTPVTALLVLGWLMRRMRMVARRTSGLEAETPGWIMGAKGVR